MAPSPPCNEFSDLHLESGLGHQNNHEVQAGRLEQAVQGKGHLDMVHTQTSSILPSPDLAASWYAGDERIAVSNRQLLGPSAYEEQGQGGDYADQQSRKRGTSISFDPKATLDNGARHSIDEPLPKPPGSQRRNRGRSVTNDMTDGPLVGSPQFDPQIMKVNPFTGEPVRRRTRRSDTAPKLETLLSQDTLQDIVADGSTHVASLTSASTASPTRDEAQTPMISPSGSIAASPTGYPSPGVSPTLSSDPWGFSRNGSVRSSRQTFSSRPSSLRKESRRFSKRSISSSSPASAFLSQWGRESISSVVPEPDDEGQAFGLNNEYIIGRQIGYGGFSVVKEAFTISDDGNKSKQAVKIVRKTLAEKVEVENDKCQQEFEHEIGIWRYLKHKNLLPLHAVYDTEFATFCVMDLNEGGTLFDCVLQSRKSGRKGLDLQLVKSYSFQLACALRYLHEDVRVAHRDVKLENCLVDRTRDLANLEAGVLRLCDFGLAEFVNIDRGFGPGQSITDETSTQSTKATVTHVQGSLEYAAPEILRAKKPLLNPAVDIWAFGICVYALVTGDLPFKHGLQSKVIDLITKGEWNEEAVRTAPCAQDGAQDLVDLLRGCLETDPDSRWNVENVLTCRLFADCGDPYDGYSGWDTTS